MERDWAASICVREHVQLSRSVVSDCIDQFVLVCWLGYRLHAIGPETPVEPRHERRTATQHLSIREHSLLTRLDV
jgi:hypothetical protein